MVAKFNSKKHLFKKVFFSGFVCVSLQSLQEVLIWSKHFFSLKNAIKVSKNTDFDANFESIEKATKTHVKKVIIKKVLDIYFCVQKFLA